MKAVDRIICLTLAAILTTPAYAELELRLTFEDPLNPAVDVSGKDRPVELIPEGGAFLDEIIWAEDAEHGGVLQYPGDNNGWVYAEIPNLPGEAFTVMLWAYRDPDSCCLGGGANDGLFQVTSDGDPELGPPTGSENYRRLGSEVGRSGLGTCDSRYRREYQSRPRNRIHGRRNVDPLCLSWVGTVSSRYSLTVKTLVLFSIGTAR